MTLIVVDASAMGPLIVPDEAENLIPGLVDVLTGGRALVTSHWPLEIANLALMAVRRKRLSEDEMHKKLSLIATFPIDVDDRTGEQAWTDILALSLQHGLSVYDGAYLELACRRRAAIATYDVLLAKAAIASDVASFT